MTDIWSLVFFTVLGQTAAGLSLFIALDREGVAEENQAWTAKARFQTWVAIGILVAGTLLSLLHLADPFISFYSITNMFSSWLSREILTAGLFGAVMLFGVLFKIGLLRYLAPVAGLLFVFVMSRVYMVPNQSQWNTWLTPAAFFTTAVMLGAALKLVLDSFNRYYDYPALRRLVLGRLPALVSLLAGVRLVLLLVRHSQGMYPLLTEDLLHAALLLLGAGAGLVLLTRGAAKTGAPTVLPQADNSHTRGMIAGSLLVFALLFVAEILGRVVFYKSYTWFGM